MKKIIFIFISLFIILFAIYGAVYFNTMLDKKAELEKQKDDAVLGGAQYIPEDEEPEKPVQKEEKPYMSQTVIGKSVEGRDIVAYHYGNGDDEILFVGGIHGGYEWNTVLVAYMMMDYLQKNPSLVSENEKVTVVPLLNPDGLHKVLGVDGRFSKSDVKISLQDSIPGRFNANNVDLNRNFDCDWQPEGVWKTNKVNAGTSVFSEPESKAIKQYVETRKPKAVIVWYSSVGGVFSSNCHNGVLPETLTLTNIYAKASGYKAYEKFDFYKITGDFVNWLAKKRIPGISILLTTHSDVDWDKNKKGINAVLKHYAKDTINLEDNEGAEQ
jgi:hypothetical protein